LKLLRTTLNISEELHEKLEAEVRGEFLSSKEPTKIAPNDVNIMINDKSANQANLQSSKPSQIEAEVPMPKSKTILSTKPSKASKPSKPSKPSKISKTSKPYSHPVKLREVKIKKYLTLAKQKYQKKNYKDSLKLLREAQEIDPENEELKFYIKKVKLKQKSVKVDVGPKGKKSTKSEKEVEETSVGEVGVREKITPSRAEQKKAESQSAIPVGNLNGAPINHETIGTLLNEKPGPIDDPTKVEDQVTSKIVTLTKPEKPKCISCNGTGSCYWCNGTGKCDRCAGTGIYDDETCTICSGTGKCNSCVGEGTCMWCRGKGIGKQMNTIYSKKD
jgi:hypothetical protein